ncbi:MAG: hypothetical protein ACYDBV_13715, partial [Nitrospiria bacterium]
IMEGDFSSNVSIEGAGLTLADMEKDLSGKGAFDIQNGALKTVNLLKQISILSELTELKQNSGLEETKFETLNGEFMIDHGKMNFQALKGSLSAAELTGKGTVDFHQNIDFNLKILLNKDVSTKLPHDLQILLVDSDQRAVFPVTLTGPLKSPAVHLEISGMKQKAVREGIKQGIKSLLDRLSPR